MSRSSNTILFLHLPKTGGTTLQKILERNFERDEVLTLNGHTLQADIDRFREWPETQRARYRLIKGHLRFGLHRSVPGAWSYITFLREPTARVLSFYKYASTTRDHYLHCQITQGATLKNLLRRNETPELFNLQTRMIAGDEWNNLGREVDDDALRRAEQNLRTHFSFVGLTEEFDASVCLLCRRFHWATPYYRMRNVTEKERCANAIDAETREMVREANSLDAKLYKCARGLFEARRQAEGPDFARTLSRFQRWNPFYGFAYELGDGRGAIGLPRKSRNDA